MHKNQKIIMLGVTIVLVLVLGTALMRNAAKEKPKISFAESNLSSLEGKLESLSIEDLGGLSESGSLHVSSQNLDQISQSIERLEFDDLEGLPSS